MWWYVANHVSTQMGWWVKLLCKTGWILVLGMYHESSTAVHWLQNTRDENHSLGLQWSYLKNRVLIHLLLSVLWLAAGTSVQSCWMPWPACKSEHTDKTHAATPAWWSWHLCSFLCRRHIPGEVPFISDEWVSICSCFRTWGPIQSLLEARGDICLIQMV